MAAPTESKVYASTLGAGAFLTISQLVTWAIGVVFFHASAAADAAEAAINAVPDPIRAALALGITAGGTFAAGWYAKHSPRVVMDDSIDRVKAVAAEPDDIDPGTVDTTLVA